ncbi:MAG: CRISPR-associated protein Csx19 [Oscillospiraceae bacterium]
MELYKETGIISEKDIISRISQYDGTVYALYTDKLTCGDMVTDTENLLEVRIFNRSSEVKFSRTSVNKDFKFRIIDDECIKKSLETENDDFLKNPDNRILEDVQYLDIDEKKSSGNVYTATGGGKYTLPFENAEKIKIYNYIDYDENGIAAIKDFRIVEIIRKEKM